MTVQEESGCKGSGPMQACDKCWCQGTESHEEMEQLNSCMNVTGVGA